MNAWKAFFVLAALYLAWRAFKYSHFINLTNMQNKQWLDEMFPEHKDTNAIIADRHRRVTLVEYTVGAAVCALIAYFI
jgi:hypothetical protein